MGHLVYGMLASLDGYIAGPPGGAELPPPSDALHWHFNDKLKATALTIYGRRLYEVMRYWQTADDEPGASAVSIDFARAWRASRRIVFSRSLTEVVPGVELARGELGTEVARLKAEVDGEIEIGGAELAEALIKLGLVDEIQLYLQPVVLGGGKPFFADPAAVGTLALLGSDRLAGDTVLLRYRPA